MGTRSITTFTEKYDNKEYPLVAIYQHYDGYIISNDVIKIEVTNFDNSEPIFVGTPQELLDFEEGES